MINKNAVLSIVLLSFGSLLGAFLAFSTQVVLARNLSISDLGVFAAALATIVLVTPLAGFGVSSLWLKLFGEEGWDAKRWLTPSFYFVFISTLLVILFLGVWIVFGNHDQITRFLIALLSFHLIGQAAINLASSKFQLEERYVNLSILQLLPHLIRFVLICLLAFIFTDIITPINIAFVYAFTGILFTFLSLIQLRKMSGDQFHLKGHEKKQNTYNTPAIFSVLKSSWPFGLATFFYLIYFQSDLILIKYMINDSAAGVYNVAFTIMMAVLLFPGILYQKYLLPKLHRWANHDKKKFYMIYRKGNFIMLVLGTLSMILTWLLSSWAIPFIFGNKYEDAITLLNILAISSPIIFVTHSTGATLTTQNYMKLKVKYMGLVALINIILNLILIPALGAIGAAIATVASNFILLILYYYASEKIVFKNKNHFKTTLV